MAKINSLDELLVDLLKDTYDAEHQITKALPKMAQAASSSELRAAFEKHLRETEQQIQKVESVFQMLGESPSRKTCKAMQGLVAEGQEVLQEDMDDDVRDAALIASAQKIEHYEIASYGTMRTFARLLNHDDAVQVLQDILDQEGDTDQALTNIAEGNVNLEARQ